MIQQLIHMQVSIDVPVTAPTSATACVQFCDVGSATQMQAGVVAAIAGVRPTPVCWIPPSRPVDVEEASGGKQTYRASFDHVPTAWVSFSQAAGANAQTCIEIMGTSIANMQSREYCLTICLCTMRHQDFGSACIWGAGWFLHAAHLAAGWSGDLGFPP